MYLRHGPENIPMWPWEHLAVGYLGYTLFTRFRYRRPPTSLCVILLAFGTQFPDLVDKPLAWTLDVLPSGRSLGHSLFTALIAITIVWWIFEKYGHERAGTAFGFGLIVHLLTDLPAEVLRGEYSGAAYLLWPLGPESDAEESVSIADGFAGVGVETFGLAELLILLLLVLLWLIDGAPGADVIVRQLFGPRRDSSAGTVEEDDK